MASEQPIPANTPDNNQEQSGSSSGKFVMILVVITILGFIVYQLTSTGGGQPSHDSDSSRQTEEVHPGEDTKMTPPVSQETHSDENLVGNINTTGPSEEAIETINNFLTDWKKAWQKSAGPSGNLEKYFSFYAPSFSAGTMDREDWQKSKTIRNQGKSWIEVWLSDIAISEIDSGHVKVTFKQEYSSSNYSDKSTKALILLKTQTGFEIISEKTL